MSDGYCKTCCSEYDPGVGGEALCPYCEIKRLRERIEELENSGETGYIKYLTDTIGSQQELLKDGHYITNEQIDAAAVLVARVEELEKFLVAAKVPGWVIGDEDE